VKILKNIENFDIFHAVSGVDAQNVAGTSVNIGTRLTQPRSHKVQSKVYFIACADFIKIGVSDNPRRRIAHLQSSSPFDLELLGDVPGDAEEEIRIQGKFAKHHVRGEWFRKHSDIIDYIAYRNRRTGLRKGNQPLQNLNGRDWIWL
jgi:hypothetical protein